MNPCFKSLLFAFSVTVVGCNSAGSHGEDLRTSDPGDMAMPGGGGNGGGGGGGSGGSGGGDMSGGDMSGGDMSGGDMTLPDDHLPDITHFVDPFIGTGKANVNNPVGGGTGGSVFPGAVVPWGMIQFSPDTPNGEPSGYEFGDTSITGFSLTHFSGAGCPNNGDLPILPLVDAAATSLPFAHAGEHASPGAYDVTSTNGIKTELTATLRTGFARFTYPAGKDPIVVLDASRSQTASNIPNHVVLDGNDGLSGYTVGGHFCGGGTFPIYFKAKFDRPFKASSTVVNGKAVLTFDGAAGGVVQLKIGVSYYSQDNAALNLTTENGGFDFAAVKEQARRQWNRRLHAIDVTGGSDDTTKKLYTALYHTLLHPNVYSDVNGDYIGFEHVNHRTDGGRVQYANFSGWDIYRTEIQLIALLYPDITSDIIQSLVNDAQQCGAFPKWSQNNVEDNVMAGDPGSLIVANGFAFGAKSFDLQGALAVMRNMSLDAGANCNGANELPALNDYNGVGYAAWTNFSASDTLEYAARDAAVSQFAAANGDADLARMTRARSGYWRNQLHSGGLMQPRYGNGTWINPLEQPGQGFNGGYVEGNAEQYTWFVPHDARGLFDALGGNTAVVTRLDKFFTQLNAGGNDPYCYIGNEPAFNDPFLYDFAGAPWRTQDVVNRAINEVFSTQAGGLPGNDDLGATSSWLVWAMLGVFPQLPGAGGLAVGSPTFASAAVHLAGGKTFTITASGLPGHYVQSAKLNGAATTKLWLPIDTVFAGGTLDFALGANINTSWGSADADAPPSFGPGSFGTMSDAANSDGVSADGQAHQGSFDGFGWSYSQSEIDKSVKNGSFTFTDNTNHVTVAFPWATGTSALDNAIAVGQTITFTPVKARYLAFLGSASAGPSTGTVVPHYNEGDQAGDGKPLVFSDWTLNGGGATPTAGNQIAITTAYRNQPNGSAQSIATYVLYALVPVDAARTIKSVTLPGQVSAGRMHIFSVVAVP